jgi:predicted nucleic acid-binding protein
MPDRRGAPQGSKPDTELDGTLFCRESRLLASNEVLDALVKVSVPIPFWFLWRPRLKDPADEMVLETAVNGEADWLVTFNVRHLAAAAREFGIKALRPCDAWKEIRKHEKK